jgi:hypothetical protein
VTEAKATLPQDHFTVGETVLINCPGVPHHGDEVMIDGLPEVGTIRYISFERMAVNVLIYPIRCPWTAMRLWSEPQFLRRKPGHRDLVSWSSCVWQPVEAVV